jgi:hypothetical protein
MARAHAVQLSTTQAGAATTPQQKRFNSLIRRIEEARRTLAAWPAAVATYRQAYAQVLEPLLDARDDADKRLAFALDALLEQRGWTKTERETLSMLVCDAAGALLQDGDADPALKALFDKHADVDFDTEQQESLHAMTAMAELMTGLDLGEAGDIRSEADLFERVRQGFVEQDAAEQAARDAEAAPRPARRKSAAQLKREAEAQQATQSVREIYRKLASALHPDRETDPAQREAKTALMQKANQAYQAGDLLTLLELQLQIEQIDADHAIQASPQRLKHYIKVLAEQLDELQAELLHAQAAFGAEFGLHPGLVTQPQQLVALAQRQARELRADVARVEEELDLLRDKATTKRWLKAERRRLRNQGLDFDFF